MYNPIIGRFLQPDPIGYADSMNLYSYVGNNSLNFIDPYGLVGDVSGFGFIGLYCSKKIWRFSLEFGSDSLLFGSWYSGLGPDTWYFGPGTIEAENMYNAPGLEKYRKKFHEKRKSERNTADIINEGTKYGLKGVAQAGFDPTEQFVGSYYVTIKDLHNGKKFIKIRNRTSLTSASYKRLPSHTRSQFGPCGDMWQVYWWIEDVNR